MVNTELLIKTLLHILPVLYGVAFFDYLLVFVSEDKMVGRLARPVLVAAVIVNLLYMLAYTVKFEYLPLTDVYQMLGAVAFALAGIYLWVESRTGTPYTGPFFLFLVLVLQIVNAEFERGAGEIPTLLQNRMFSFHVLAAVIGYSAFAISAVYGLLYLQLYRRMRGKNFGLVFRRLPSLDVLDRMNYNASLAGFAFLALAVVLGILWSRRVPQSPDLPKVSDLDPKVIVAIFTLVIYGGALAGRRFGSWRGPKFAYSALLGFMAILFSIFGVNFFFTSFHGFRG